MKFDNPEYDKDDYDKDEAETSFINEEQFQRTLKNQYDALEHLKGQDHTDHYYKVIKMMVDQFYERNQEPVRFDEQETEWQTTKDELGRPLLGIQVDDKTYPLSYYKTKNPEAPIQFYSFDTLQRKNGVNFVREVLGVTDFDPSAARIAKGRKEFQVLLSTRNDLSAVEEHIPMQNLSSATDIQDLTTAVSEMDTSFLENWDVEERVTVATQTDLDKREMDGILKAMTTVKEELTNELAKLAETNKDIASEKQKLQQTDDETQVKKISGRLTELESERSARIEVININKEKLRSQINRIKETINKVLKEDTTLGERIRTLFREQGITIVSILTAVGMIIGVIVESIIPSSSSSGTTSPPPPKSSDGIKDWVKKQLSNLGNLLAKLAGKAAAALPGIIGSIVSWLLSTTGKVVNWFGNNLWALVIVVAGLLYEAARRWINDTGK